MIQLIIDGKVADLQEDVLSALAITYEGNNIGTLADRNGDFVKNFDLPLTGNNRAILGLSDQIPSATDTGALLPCEVYYTNWLIFKGSLRIARYFGNKAQVEIIGTVGTLVANVANLTLGDFDYPDFEVVQNTSADYTPLMTATPGLVKVGKVDNGVWNNSKNANNNGVPQMYNTMLPLWYDLLETLRQVCNGLNYDFGGDIVNDSDIKVIYIQQGYWGVNRLLKQYNNNTATGTIGTLRVRDHIATDFTISISDLPWLSVALNGFEYINNIGSVAGKYKITIKWTGHTRFSGPATYTQLYDIIVFAGYQSAGTNYANYGSTRGQIEFSNTYTGSGSITIELDYYLTDTSGPIPQLQICLVGLNLPYNTTIDINGLTCDIEFNTIDTQLSQDYKRPQDVLPRITVADFFLDVCQRFGYIINVDDSANIIRFNKLLRLSNRSDSVDWNGKIESPLDSQFETQYQTEFVFGSYGEQNMFRDASGLNDGILYANVNNSDVVDGYISIGSEVSLEVVPRPFGGIVPNTDLTKSFGGEGSEGLTMNIIGTAWASGDVAIMEGLPVKNLGGTSITAGGIPAFILVDTGILNGVEAIAPSDIFKWQNNTLVYGKLAEARGAIVVLGERHTSTTVANPACFAPYIGGWQSALDRNYQWLSAILSKPRIHKVLLRLRPTDLPIDFSKPVYWNCAYWYVVSVQDWNPLTQESCVAILAQIPDYPTA